MPTPLNPTTILKYLTGGEVHAAYTETVKMYADLKAHIDGEYPKTLLEMVRPNEPDHIKRYREQIFAHTTMPLCSKVITSLSKIRKSRDWNIKFNEEAVPKIIAPEETPKQYFNYGFPTFGSVTNWAFNVFLKQYLTDPNAVIVTMPMNWKLSENEYFKPFPFIFNSDKVVQFIEDDYCIVKSDETAQGRYTAGNIFYVITTTDFQRWEPNNSEQGYFMAEQLFHNSGKLPAWRAGGLGHKVVDRSFIWKSRIYPMVPFLNEAAREYSDLQAGVFLHLFLERWEIEGPKCKTCSGTGKMLNKSGGSVKCTNKNCDSGAVMSSPYRPIIMRKGTPGEVNPSVPAGYIDKNPEIIKIQDERVDKHYFKALASINMEFLAVTPLSTSGVSKSYDRDEGTNFVHGVGEDVVFNIDKYVFHATEQRYMVAVPSKEVRKTMLPDINVPEKLDIFTSQMIIEELNQMRTAKVSSSIIQAAEMEVVSKMFSYDSDMVAQLQLSSSLDPLSGKSTDEKASELMNKGVTETDYVISCNISAFVRRALVEDKNFASKPLKDQMALLTTYAKEKISENSEADQLKMEAAARAMEQNPEVV